MVEVVNFGGFRRSDGGIFIPNGTYSNDEKHQKKFGKKLSPGRLTRHTSSFWLPILLTLKKDIRDAVFLINLISRSFDEVEDCLVLDSWGEDYRAAGLHDLFNFYKGDSLEKFNDIGELVNTFRPAIIDPRRQFLLNRVSDIRAHLYDSNILSDKERIILLGNMKDMKDGMQNYLGGGMGSWKDLITYCLRVAGRPGKAVHGLVDSKRGGLPPSDMANNLGLALQITNTIRDIAGDLREGRSYLVEDGIYDGIENIREFLSERNSIEDLTGDEKISLKRGHDKIVREFTDYAILSLGYVFGSGQRDYDAFTKLLLGEASNRMKASHIRWDHLDEDISKVYFGSDELEYSNWERAQMFGRCLLGLYNLDSYEENMVKPHILYLNESWGSAA